MPRQPRSNQASQKRTVTKPLKAARSTTRSIVVFDEEPLRQKANEKRRKYLKQLGTAQRSLQRFEERDIPSFEQWRAAEFGARLTQLRDLEAELREIGPLVDAVEDAHYFTGRPFRECYEKIKQAKENPDAFFDADDPFEEEDDDDDPYDLDDDFDDFEDLPPPTAEELECDILEAFSAMTGIDFDPNDPEFKILFEQFKRQFGFTGDTTTQHRKSPRDGAAPGLKSTYRALARKLHPDHRESLGAFDSRRLDDLWHEAQEAYNHCDLDTLQRIDALIDIEANGVAEQTDLERIEHAAEHHRQSLRAIERSIREARKHPAWMFSKKAASKKKTLRQRINWELDELLAEVEGQVAYCRRKIAQWSKPIAKKSPARKQSKSTRKKSNARGAAAASDPSNRTFSHPDSTSDPSTSKTADAVQMGFSF